MAERCPQTTRSTRGQQCVLEAGHNGDHVYPSDSTAKLSRSIGERIARLEEYRESNSRDVNELELHYDKRLAELEKQIASVWRETTSAAQYSREIRDRVDNLEQRANATQQLLGEIGRSLRQLAEHAAGMQPLVPPMRMGSLKGSDNDER